jgi:hypothetical protein
MNTETITLNINWSTSRGQNTYGYNICRIEDNRTGKRYRTCGGGYDMLGSVLGEWLTDRYQDRLRAISHLAGSYYSKATGYQSHRKPGASLPFGDPDPAYFYGMSRDDDTGRVTLDGACGISTMQTIANAIGLTFLWVGNRKGHTVAYVVTDHGMPEPQKAAA